MTEAHSILAPGATTRGTAILTLILVLSFCGARAGWSAEITVASLTSTAVSDVGPYHQDVQDAIGRFKARDVEGARRYLEAARKSTPQLAPVEVMLAQMLFLSGSIPAGRAELERATLREPQDPESYLTLADLDFGEGRYAEATLLFGKGLVLANAMTDNPKRKGALLIRAWAGLAAIDEHRENWTAARDDLQAWLKLEESSTARQRLGRALFKAGDQKGALKEFQTAAKADTKLQAAELTMAVLFKQAGDSATAEKWFTAAAKRPTDVPTRLGLAQWLLQVGQTSEAQIQIDEAAKLDPRNPEVMAARGFLALLQKDYKQAVTSLEAAHLLAPGNLGTTDQLAIALLETDSPESQKRAIDFAELAYRQNNANLEAAATLGWVYYRAGRMGEAEQALKPVASSSSLTAEMAYYLACLLRDQSRTADAIKLLESSLQSERPFIYRPEAKQLLGQLRKPAPAAATSQK